MIDIDNWEIIFEIPRNFINQFKKLSDRINEFLPRINGLLSCPDFNFYDENKIPIKLSCKNELYNFLASLALHEFGHSKECPIDGKNFALILQAVSTALEQKSEFNDKILYYIINMFSDIIVNLTLGLDKEKIYFNYGFYLFSFYELLFYNYADISYYFFVLINLFFLQPEKVIGDKFKSLLLLRMPTNYKITLEKLLKIFCPFDDIAKNLMLDVPLNENEKWKIINHVSMREKWRKMAYDFTIIIHEYISTALIEHHQPINDSFFIRKFINESKFQKQILEEIIKHKGFIDDDGDFIENVETFYFDTFTDNDDSIQNFEDTKFTQISNNVSKNNRKMDHAEIKKNLKFETFKTSILYPFEKDFEYGFANFNDLEKFDIIYEKRVKKFEISTASKSDNDSITLTWLNRKIMEDKNNLINFDALNVFFLPGSDEILLYKKLIPYKIEENGYQEEKSFPNIVIICDDSGSMDWDPLTGRGKFDAVIIMVYSLFNWLRSKSFAPVIEYNFVFFSDTTRSTGWIDYFNLDKVKKLLFNPEGGGTVLNPKIFQEILESPKKKIVILISDGLIYNYKPLYYILKENSNQYFMFVQIGNLSKFANLIKSLGLDVIKLEDVFDLSKIVLNFIEKSYSTKYYNLS